MNIEELREYCLTFKHVTEEFPFDETTLVFKVLGKMFLYTDIIEFERVAVKCDPDKAIVLRSEYEEDIRPAFHSNKRMWNDLYLNSSLSDKFIQKQIEESYKEVVKKMSKRFVSENFPDFSLTGSNRIE